MNAWSLVYEGFDPAKEALREALCTVGNGYFATRGAAPESEADGVHYPGTYVAGVYNRLTTEVSGHAVENEDLVNAPNWLSLAFRIEGGDWFHLRNVEVIDYRQELDLRRGVLLRSVDFRDSDGRQTKMTQRRFVHMRDPHLAGLETTFLPVDWSGHLEVRSALDGRVKNCGVPRYRQLRGDHLDPVETGEEEDLIYLQVETKQSHVRIAESARTRLRDGQATERRLIQEPGYVAHQLSLQVREGEAATVEKVVALFTSRDPAISECGLEARQAARRAGGFDWLLEQHALAWHHLWRRFLLDVDTEESTRMVLRLHIFHLLQTASKHTMELDVGVPARGLHGEAYRGHVFWDELFIFPFLNLHLPDLTRSFLQYRFRRLPEARWAARAAGYEGALFPWQSGSNGREESQTVHLNPRSGRWVPDHSRLQRHVNVAIPYNVWHYYQVTGDVDFLAFSGAELLTEAARLWASMATYNKALDRYEILGVMGPDEYHDAYPGADRPGIDNNAYSNVMAVWVLLRAGEALEAVPGYRREELWDKLALRREELERWEEITHRMRVAFHGDGIISQFEGYEDLEEFDWDAYRKKYQDIQRLDRILEAEGDTPNRYKLSKQADVLMLFYLLSADELGELFRRLGYEFGPETIPRNIDYYLRRTSHGSTLSGVVHSWVLARSDRKQSWELFLRSLASDITDIQGGTTPEGIHLGAMAGTVDMVQRGYTGVETRRDVLWLNPALPEEIRSMTFEIVYRGCRIDFHITPEEMRVRASPDATQPVTIGISGELIDLEPGETRVRAL